MKLEQQPTPLNPEALLFNEFAKLLETNPNLKFTVSGVGNIVGGQGGDTQGQRLFQYNNTTKKLENNDNLIGTFGGDAVDDENKVLPLFQKQIIELIYAKVIYLGFKKNIKGEKSSAFMSELRGGAKLFVGFEAKIGKKLYSKQEADLLMQIKNISKEKPSVFIQMIEALCNKYIPQYYNEIKRFEAKHNKI